MQKQNVQHCGQQTKNKLFKHIVKVCECRDPQKKMFHIHGHILVEKGEAVSSCMYLVTSEGRHWL